MAAGDVWDYIFGSYVNAVRALPYINDDVIVIRRLNARGAVRSRATPLERERADRCTHSVLRSVTHCEIRPTVTASRTRSIKSDDGMRDRDWEARMPRHRRNRAVQLGEIDYSITGCGS